jgi:Kef-type K+ transport system membrane component KefB
MWYWRRLALLATIGASMAIVNAINEDLFIGLVAVSLLVLPVFVWSVFFVLHWLSRQAPDIQSLHERAEDMLTSAIALTVAAAIAAAVLARLLKFIEEPIGNWITVGIAFVIVTTSLSAMRLLRTARDVWLPMIRRRP